MILKSDKKYPKEEISDDLTIQFASYTYYNRPIVRQLSKNFNYSKMPEIFCVSGFVEYDVEIYNATLSFADFLSFTLISKLKAT